MREPLEELVRREVRRQLKASLHVDTDSADSLALMSRTLDWSYRRMKAEESTSLWAKRFILGLIISGIGTALWHFFKTKGGQ